MGIVRIILALAVVIGHTGKIFGYALFEPAAAVQCFYVISGFYMALVLERTYAPGRDGVRSFYISRYLRLAPTYWVILAATLVSSVLLRRTIYHPWSEVAPLVAVMGAPSLAFLVLTNLFIVGQDAVMFLAVDPAGGPLFWTAHFAREAHPAYRLMLVPQAWSLGVELLFYLVAPFILRRRTRVLAAVFLLSVALRVTLMASGLTADPWSYRFFPTELATFLAGSLAYRAYRRGIGVATARWAGVILAGLIAILILYRYLPAAEAVKRFGMTAIMAAVLPSIFSLTRAWKRDTFVGKLSYPVYLSHLMLLTVARHAGRFRGPALIVLSLAVAVLLVVFVEDRVDRWRSRLRSPTAPRPRGTPPDESPLSGPAPGARS